MSSLESGNLLVRHPGLYEYIYPEAGRETQAVCRKLMERYAPKGHLRILDIGTGTGANLASLTEMGHEGFGIDVSQPMIEYARVRHPELRLQYGDMRNFDMGERFQVLMCLGSTFTNNLSNSDLHSALASFRRHMTDNGLLILDILNACRFLSSEFFNERVETRVDEGDFHATSMARHLLDRRKQSFRRVRTWKIDGQNDLVVDDAEFRLFFPLEIEDYLARHGFSVIGMWDNKELADSDLSARRLYIAAQAVP